MPAGVAFAPSANMDQHKEEVSWIGGGVVRGCTCVQCW
jgi:hypothetical protein